MDAPINEIIKNIIHIDKSAVQLREKLSKEIGERKIGTSSEIEMLRASILDEEMKRIEKMEEEEIKNTEIKADKIKLEALEKSNQMYDRFLASKDELIKEMFKKIISK